jgi:putative membrane protein
MQRTMNDGRVKRFLTREEERRVVECVKEAERTTCGEIVPMVVTASYHYPLAAVLGALVVGLVLATAATAAITFQQRLGWGTLAPYELWVFPGVFAAVFLAAHEVIRRVPGLKRLFIRPEEMEQEVREAALTSFYRRGLDKTRDQSGVLIFVSVFEREVEVLADRGINARVDPAAWEEVVRMVTSGIRERRQGEALCRAVSRCGELLREHFPWQRDDVDELDNLIVEE